MLSWIVAHPGGGRAQCCLMFYSDRLDSPIVAGVAGKNVCYGENVNRIFLSSNVEKKNFYVRSRTAERMTVLIPTTSPQSL